VGATGGATAANADPFVIEVAPTDTLVATTHRLVRALMLRCSTPSGAANPPVMPSTEWLAAALTNRVLFGNRERYGQSLPDYGPVRYAFQRGAFPDLGRLVMHPVPADQAVLYRLYAMHADVLALCLTDSAGLDAIRQVLELDARGRTPLDAVAFVAQDGLRPGETLQDWYSRTAGEVSRRGRRPSDTVTTAERFTELATVPVVAPGEHDFRGNRLPWDEAPEKLEALRQDPAALAALQQQLFELVKDAPFPLQVPIGRYADACRGLAAGSARSSRNALRKARKEFDGALAHQRRLDEYLDEQERRHVPAEERLGLTLDVVARYVQAERGLDPELHRYLDRVPKLAATDAADRGTHRGNALR
jgi:hypothetical protein